MIEKKEYYTTRTIPQKVAMYYYGKLKKGKVLDIGCGSGDFGKYKPSGFDVYGVDIDRKAIKTASAYEHAQVCDIEKGVPFKDRFFDSVFAKDIVEHVLKPYELMSEISRTMKKNGVLIVTVPMPKKEFWDDYTHIRPFTKKGISDLFKDTGFKVVSIRKTGSIPFFGMLKIQHLLPFAMKIPLVKQVFSNGWEIVGRKE